MNRLTTDTPKDNTETMLNMAYAENSWVKIRGMEKEFTSYLAEQCRRTNKCDLSDCDAMEICEAITECNFSNPHCPIFLLHTVAVQAAELRARLKEYEDTGLEPEEINGLCEMSRRKKLGGEEDAH